MISVLADADGGRTLSILATSSAVSSRSALTVITAVLSALLPSVRSVTVYVTVTSVSSAGAVMLPSSDTISGAPDPVSAASYPSGTTEVMTLRAPSAGSYISRLSATLCAIVSFVS